MEIQIAAIQLTTAVLALVTAVLALLPALGKTITSGNLTYTVLTGSASVSVKVRSTKLKAVIYAFLGAGKNGGRSLYVKVRSSKLKSYKSLILRKGGNKKLTVKKA